MSCAHLYSSCWKTSPVLHLKSLTTIIDWSENDQRKRTQTVSFPNSATGLWEKAESKARSAGTLSSRGPSRPYLGTDSDTVEELFPSSREGTCKASPAHLQEGPSSPLVLLSFPKLLHPRFSHFLAISQGVWPLKGQTNNFTWNGPAGKTALSSDNDLVPGFSRERPWNQITGFGAAQARPLLGGFFLKCKAGTVG